MCGPADDSDGGGLQERAGPEASPPGSGPQRGRGPASNSVYTDGQTSSGQTDTQKTIRQTDRLALRLPARDDSD
jgi:hypothetical protein